MPAYNLCIQFCAAMGPEDWMLPVLIVFLAI